MSADADRIVALEAELAEARKERDAALLHAKGANTYAGQLAEDTGRYMRERDAAQSEAAAMRDWCAAWLIRARLAIYREGWEEGMSVREAGDALTSVLFNLGCDDGSERAHDIAETKRLLAMPITYKPPAGRALAARVPLWRELENWCLQMQGHAKSPTLDHVLAMLATLDAKEPK